MSKETMKPCSEPCLKCGSGDICRTHRRMAEEWGKTIGDYREYENEFVTVSGFTTVAKKECITHHCRVCGYEWQGDILPVEK